jgi:acetyl esterase
MFGSHPSIRLGPTLKARGLQAAFPWTTLRRMNNPATRFHTKQIADPSTIAVPSRHGDMKALLYKPTESDIATQLQTGHRPPVHLITHGGGFIVRLPEQEDNVARYIASEAAAYVIIPDFLTAPTVIHPVSEQQAYDSFVWIHDNADVQGWDGDRITVGGSSAGGQTAFTVIIQAIDAGGHLPIAASSEYGVADVSRPDDQKPSPLKRPMVPPALNKLVRDTYFVEADLTDPLVSPIFYERLAEFPPTLVMTAEYDTLRHEMNEMAAVLTDAGVEVTYKEFKGVDHGFTHFEPFEVVEESLRMISDHLRKAYERKASEGSAVTG